MDAARSRVHQAPIVLARHAHPVAHDSGRPVPRGSLLTGVSTTSSDPSFVPPPIRSSRFALIPPGPGGSVLAATAVALALRLFRLGHSSLWVDEIITWYSVQNVAPSLRTLLHENVHGPLYSLLLGAWVRLARDGELAMRLPSAGFAGLLVPPNAGRPRGRLAREAGGS